VSYRDTALACPVCSDALDPCEVGEAVIDVCPGCGGIWVDWFDGELVALVRGAPGVPGARAPERAGSSECPRCRRPLDGELYLDSRAEILRCADCAGAFVPRASARVVAGYDADADGEGRPATGDALRRLGAVLKRWLGWEESDPG
jgi:Zn-finger nucleic acid-binding protein